MSNLPIILFSLLSYVLLVRFLFSLSDQRIKQPIFALVNIGFFIWLSLLIGRGLIDHEPAILKLGTWDNDAPIFTLGSEAVIRHIGLIGFYVLIVAVGFYLMRAFSKRQGILPWLAFFYPIAILILIKYLHSFWNPLLDRFEWKDWVITATIIGLSYMAFRLSYLVLEVRNGTAQMPTLSEYLGFAFFLPTLVVGPINPFSTHQNSIQEISKTTIPVGRCLMRIIVGATKYLFLANLANQLSYSGIFLDGKPHAMIDLVVAVIFYYLFLYCNFSGFCDVGIGIAGLMGVKVKENFDNPFAARNVKEFWNRWHITLSEYTRNVIFAPLSKFLIKRFGIKYTNFSIAVSILVVFLVIGIWHGVGWRFAIFGLIHAAGIIANQYYTIWLKRKLGKAGYKRYNENPLINALAIILTFGYVAASFMFFANTYDTLGIIKNALRDGFQF